MTTPANNAPPPMVASFGAAELAALSPAGREQFDAAMKRAGFGPVAPPPPSPALHRPPLALHRRLPTRRAMR
jgi:hypothetical protein